MGPRWVGGITAWAGLGLLGLLLIVVTGPERDEPVPDPVAFNAVPQPWNHSVAWIGQISARACAPTGIEECAGVTHGGHDDLRVLADEHPTEAHFVLEWDATATGVSEFGFWLDAARIRHPCDSCTSYRFRILEHVEGTSPLRIDASTVSLQEGERLALLVRPLSQLDGPITGEIRTEQTFAVSGWTRGE